MDVHWENPVDASGQPRDDGQPQSIGEPDFMTAHPSWKPELQRKYTEAMTRLVTLKKQQKK